MSELAFDASGEPISFPVETGELRVRRFRNPGMRGACEVVRDHEGAPVYVPVETGYLEFRDLVEGLPGRYRLDPVDESRQVIAGAAPAYVTITEVVRQAAPAGVDDRDSVIRELARANAEMVTTIADRFASVMQAAADLLRAADGAGLPRREPPAPPPKAEVEEDDEEDEEEEEIEDELDDDEQDDDDPKPMGLSDVAALLAPLVPAVQMWLVSKASEAPAASQPAVPAVAPAMASAPSDSPPAAPAPSDSPPAAPAPGDSPPAAPAPAGLAAPPTTADPTPPRNAVVPTSGQMAHLMAIYARLAPEEKRIAELVGRRMTPQVRADWLKELSTMTVDDAVGLIRSMVPELRRKDHAA